MEAIWLHPTAARIGSSDSTRSCCFHARVSHYGGPAWRESAYLRSGIWVPRRVRGAAQTPSDKRSTVIQSGKCLIHRPRQVTSRLQTAGHWKNFRMVGPINISKDISMLANPEDGLGLIMRGGEVVRIGRTRRIAILPLAVKLVIVVTGAIFALAVPSTLHAQSAIDSLAGPDSTPAQSAIESLVGPDSTPTQPSISFLAGPNSTPALLAFRRSGTVHGAGRRFAAAMARLESLAKGSYGPRFRVRLYPPLGMSRQKAWARRRPPRVSLVSTRSGY